MHSIGPIRTLQILRLSNNQITTLEGNATLKNLTTLDLEQNNLTRVFVHQFLDSDDSKTRKSLTLNLAHNPIESIDFRHFTREALSNSSESYNSLVIQIDSIVNCTCHTVSLYNYLTSKLSPELNNRVKIIPEDIKCNDGVALKDIRKDKFKCPLDNSHHNLCPDLCQCNRQSATQSLIIKCVGITEIGLLPPYKTLKDIILNKIELRVNGNQISHLPSKIKDRIYNDVAKIHASYNFIEQILPENIPDKLIFLDVQFNKLKTLMPNVISTFGRLQLRIILLSNNPWNCRSSNDLITFVKNNRDVVKDFSSIKCSDQRYFLELAVESISRRQFIFGVMFILIISITSMSLFYIIHRKRQMLTEFIFNHDRFHLLERLIDWFKYFDAIIVSHECDKTFGKYIASKLNSDPKKFKLEIITKRWRGNIPDDVLKKFRLSKRVIIVLSDNFESNWERWNYFHTKTRIIFVVKGKTKIEEIKITNKFLVNFPDPWFWDKLKYVMLNIEELKSNNESEV